MLGWCAMHLIFLEIPEFESFNLLFENGWWIDTAEVQLSIKMLSHWPRNLHVVLFCIASILKKRIRLKIHPSHGVSRHWWQDTGCVVSISEKMDCVLIIMKFDCIKLQKNKSLEISELTSDTITSQMSYRLLIVSNVNWCICTYRLHVLWQNLSMISITVHWPPFMHHHALQLTVISVGQHRA